MKHSSHRSKRREEDIPQLRDISRGGWKTIGKTVGRSVSEDHISIVAAGVAFFFFLAVFPALAAAVSVYALVQDPMTVQQQLNEMSDMLPEEGLDIISKSLEEKAAESTGKLGWGAALSILIGVWSAKKGVNAVFQGINIAYNEDKERGFIKKNLLTLSFTFGGILFGLIALTLVAGFPAILTAMGVPEGWSIVFGAVRWLLLFGLAVVALAILFRVAPERESPKLRWITPGSLVASILWLLGSMLFSWFVSNFGNFDETYGGFSAVIVLMLWFYLSGFIVLLGAEINSTIEEQAHAERAAA